MMTLRKQLFKLIFQHARVMINGEGTFNCPELGRMRQETILLGREARLSTSCYPLPLES